MEGRPFEHGALGRWLTLARIDGLAWALLLLVVGLELLGLLTDLRCDSRGCADMERTLNVLVIGAAG